MHDEVSLDGPLWYEGTAHAGQGLPIGQYTGAVYIFLLQTSCLLDELSEHLEKGEWLAREVYTCKCMSVTDSDHLGQEK